MAVDAPSKGISWRGHADHLVRDSPFFIASCTKLYTTAIVLQLVEAGAFALDDPAHRLLPDGTMTGLSVINGKDHSHRITIRNLLSNTSGLADYFEDKTPDGTRLFKELRGGADIVLTRSKRLTEHAESGHDSPQAPQAKRTTRIPTFCCWGRSSRARPDSNSIGFSPNGWPARSTRLTNAVSRTSSCCAP